MHVSSKQSVLFWLSFLQSKNIYFLIMNGLIFLWMKFFYNNISRIYFDKFLTKWLYYCLNIFKFRMGIVWLWFFYMIFISNWHLGTALRACYKLWMPLQIIVPQFSVFWTFLQSIIIIVNCQMLQATKSIRFSKPNLLSLLYSIFNCTLTIHMVYESHSG